MSDIPPDPAVRPARSPGWRLVRRILVLVFGIPITLLGLVLLVAPGPGTPLVIAGLAILAIEFPWAQTQVDRLKKTARRMLGKPDGAQPDQS